MANLLPGEDLFGTNQYDDSVICDPTSHETEEQFSCPKISNVCSINNPTNDQVTPEPIVEGEMEAGDESQEEEPLPPLTLKVQLPSRASFLANGVHHLELILLYGHLEEHVLMIDIHGPLMELPVQKQEESEIPISDNSYASINSFPSSPPPPILNLGAEESLDDPSPPTHPPRKKITAARRRKLKESTTCKICHKKFANKYSAAIHSYVHLSHEEKEATRQGWKNKCYFCSKRLPTPSHLNIHLLIHTNEKPHPCHKCGKQFNQKRNLITHQRLHDPATRRPFNCTECDKSFTEKRGLTTHVIMVHLRLKECQCPECDQKFATRSHLERHLNGAHRRIRHPCRSCDKIFSREWALEQHRKKAHP